MSFVPEYVLWGSNSENSIENFNMWMWFISECLNSVRNVIIYFKKFLLQQLFYFAGMDEIIHLDQIKQIV